LPLRIWFYTQVRVSRKLAATNALYDFADSGESTAGCASLAWQALGEDAKRKHNAAGLFSRRFKVEDEATFLRVSGTMTGALEKKKKEKHSPYVCVMCVGASTTPLQSCAFHQMYHRSTSQNSQAHRKWRKSHKLVENGANLTSS
jgi:hypothetical protein